MMNHIIFQEESQNKSGFPTTSAEKRKRSRWDLRFNGSDNPSSNAGVQKEASEPEASKVQDFVEEEEDGLAEAEELPNYRQLLPLDTSVLRTEIIGRLQLALFGLKSTHDLATQHLHQEKQRHIHLMLFFHGVLFRLWNLQGPCHYPNIGPTERSSNALLHDAEEVIAESDSDMVHRSMCSTPESSQSREPHCGIKSWGIFLEHYHRTLQCVKSWCTEDKLSPPGPSELDGCVKSFLDAMQTTGNAASQNDSSMEPSMLIENLLLEKAVLEQSFGELKKEYNHLELLLDRSCKQISIYLSRDPLTPSVMSMEDFIASSELHIEAPQVFLSYIPQFVRSLTHLNSQSEHRKQKLQEALNVMTTLKKKDCEQQARIAQLERQFFNVSEKLNEHSSAMKSSTDRIMSLEGQVNQLVIEKSHLLQHIQKGAVSRQQEQCAVEKQLKQQCILLEAEKEELLKEKAGLENSLHNGHLQESIMQNRVLELEQRIAQAAQERCTERKTICDFLREAVQQRQDLLLAATASTPSVPTQDTVKEKTSHQMNSLLKQREHLTAELDELSATLEEKLKVISDLEVRCKERDERCICLMEEALNHQGETKSLHHQLTQLTQQMQDQKLLIKHRTQEAEARDNAFQSYLKEQETGLLNIDQENRLKMYQDQVSEQKKQIEALQAEVRMFCEKYTNAEESNQLYRERIASLIDTQTQHQFPYDASPKAEKLDCVQVSQFSHKQLNSSVKLDNAPHNSNFETDADERTTLLQLELNALRRRFLCTLCNERWKNSFIKRCGHAFCEDCLKNTLMSRNRKCPQCNQKYQAMDIQRIFDP